MDFFTGFKWAIPTAFSKAISLCCFEEGDILYDSQEAYGEKQDKNGNRLEYSLQVRHPIRIVGSSAERDNAVFNNNWNTEVRLDLYRHNKKMDQAQIITTQGRLYTMLWKGDLNILQTDCITPHVPLSAKDITKQLKETLKVAKNISPENPVFVMAYDRSNMTSQDKYLKVITKLKKHLLEEPKILSPKESGLSNLENIAPTIDIAFFKSQNISSNDLHDLVKKAVYIPAENAKKDMFKLSAHGVIF